MAAGVIAHYELRLQVEETIGLSSDLATDPTATYDISDIRGTLNATSTPAVSKQHTRRYNLTAGALTLDLTSLTEDDGTTTNFNGLKVQLLKLSCPSTNTAAITVDRGASNAYNLFGPDNTTAEQIRVMPGVTYAVVLGNDQTEDVSSTVKDVQFAGTGTESIDVSLVAG